MRHDVYIKEIIDDIGVLSSLEGEDQIELPMKYLPKGSRKGDILQIELSFDPFRTLSWNESSMKL